jgi:hypothetical protein
MMFYDLGLLMLSGCLVVVVEFINFIFCILMKKINSAPSHYKTSRYNIRAIFDWVMGIIYLGVGFILTFAPWLGIRIHFPPADVARIFGTACMIYGGFRIFRGYKTRHAQ